MEAVYSKEFGDKFSDLIRLMRPYQGLRISLSLPVWLADQLLPLAIYRTFIAFSIFWYFGHSISSMTLST